MPDRSPLTVSPADLARVRRLPAPPQPSRGRRLAEIERERVRSALVCLVADPATDFTALDADGFFAALRCACQEGLVNAALVTEVCRRVADGTVASRDLHLVLFAAACSVASQPSGDSRRYWVPSDSCSRGADVAHRAERCDR